MKSWGYSLFLFSFIQMRLCRARKSLGFSFSSLLPCFTFSTEKHSSASLKNDSVSVNVSIFFCTTYRIVATRHSLVVDYSDLFSPVWFVDFGCRRNTVSSDWILFPSQWFLLILFFGFLPSFDKSLQFHRCKVPRVKRELLLLHLGR